MQKRDHWKNQLGFVIVSAGAAIGLGNIWKFPYMVGSNGGSAFTLVYLICILLIGIPVMAAEIIVGRRAKQNPVDAIATNAMEAGHTSRWAVMGWWGFFGLLLTLSFYCVVAGWTLYYFFIALAGGLQGLTPKEVGEVWQTFSSDPYLVLLYSAIFTFLTLGVLSLGVQRGLERFSRIVLPMLFIVLILLVFYAAFKTNHFVKAAHFLFHFDVTLMTPTVIINAMGHAFFTLAIGVGAMSIYGSYMEPSIQLGPSILIIVLLDVLVALLSGMAIFPFIFDHGLAPSAGPGLMFISLPISFTQMQGGSWVGAGFFALIFFAAWTSSINIAEPIVGVIHEKTKISRHLTCVFVGLLAFLLGIVSVLSFNLWRDVKILGGFSPFDLITDTVTNIILPIGGIFYALFCGWIMKRSSCKSAFGLSSEFLFTLWRFLVRYVSPLLILVVFLATFMPS